MEVPIKVSRLNRLIALLAVLVITLSYFTAEVATGQVPTTPRGFNTVIESIDVANLMDHVRFLSNRSRFTGYSGFFEAADYIASKFQEYGLKPYSGNTYFEYFDVTTPIEHDTFLVLEDGRRIKAHMLYPNLVNPSPYVSPENGDTLIYLGNGELEKFEGADVRGKFVLMDFASRWYFYIAMAAGAKGVIFVPEDMGMVIRPEAEQKEVLFPVLFPRLYVRQEDGGLELLKLARNAGRAGIRIQVHANMTWESVRVPNVVGYIEGRDPTLSRQIIVISAYYDSWSVVPALSYGATDSLGVADLLELARFLSEHRPKRSVLVVALAGHYQGLWGAREFVERHFPELQSEIIAFAGMDVSSGSDQIGVYATGSAYIYQRSDILYPTRYSWLVTRFFQSYLTEMRMVLGQNYGAHFVDGILGSNPAYIASVRPFEPRVFGYFGLATSSTGYYQSLSSLFDADPFVLAVYGSGFTYHTSDDFRLYQRTPADTWEKVNFENVLTQAKFIHCTLWGLLNEEDLRLSPTKSRLSDDWGYVTLTVQVSEYNMMTNYYDPFNSTRHPDLWDEVLVFFTAGGLRVVTKVNERGEAVIHGMKPYSNGAVDVFVVDRETGSITWTTDIGVWQAPGWKTVPLSSHPHTKVISIFPCASIATIFAFNPGDFRLIPMMIVNNARAHGPALRYNQFQVDMFYVAFVAPDIPAEIIFTMGEKSPIAILNDADPANPNGKGYVLRQGELLVLGPDEIVRSMKSMVLSRYDKLYGFYTYTPTMQKFYGFTSKYLAMWEGARSTNEYDKLLGYSYFSWTFLLGLYGSVMDLLWQVILTLSVLFIITIPFTMIIERLIFGFEGQKRFLAIASLVFLSNAVFIFLHPGFSIANSSPLVLISTGLLIILTPLLSLMINEARASAKSMREKMIGYHFSEISRSGLFTSSMSMGLENMKKRRFRSILTLLSIVLIIFAMVSLSSVTITPQLITSASGIGNPSSFSGILIRATPWAPINEGTYTVLKSSLRDVAKVVPRSYLYPPPQPPRVTQPGVPIPYIVFSPKMETRIYGMMALSPDEPEVSNIDELLIDGRWFNEGDVFATILPDAVAKSLSSELGRAVGVDSYVSLWGMNLRVVGIVKTEALGSFYNPDGEAITPIDPSSPTTAITPNHFTGDHVIIVPYALFSRVLYVTPLATIAVKPANKTVEEVLLKELPFQLAYRIYVAEKGEIGHYLLSRQWIGFLGMEFLTVPVIIASFAILNLMLGSVHERTKEIAIYNAIGMSPLHISLSFVVEAIAYAVPAVFVGYLAGMVTTAGLIKLGAYPSELYPNFSSLIVMLVLGLDLAVTVLSSVYPSALAARLAVPSRVRRWQQITSKPKGDIWEVSIPLVVNAREEALGVYAFLREYLSQSVERESLFSAERIEVKDLWEGDVNIVRLVANCRLAPYDLGIKTDIIMDGMRERNATSYTFRLTLVRTSGYASTWRTSCPIVVDEVRKQVLIWRTLSPDDRKRYMDLAERELVRS